MARRFILSVIFMLAVLSAGAQDTVLTRRDTTVRPIAPVRMDTIKSTYVNPGKIAGRRAAIRSAIIPGMGQIGNGVTAYRLLKVGAIYTGAALLTISYVDNNNNYKRYLKELQYRVENGGKANPQGEFADYANTQALTNAKDLYARNLWVIRFSYGALYAVNIIEAYVDARLKYFDVGDDLAFKLSPSFNTNTQAMYGYTTFAPGLKLTLKL